MDEQKRERSAPTKLLKDFLVVGWENGRITCKTFSQQSNEWTCLNLPISGIKFGATELIDGKLYIIGGSSEDSTSKMVNKCNKHFYKYNLIFFFRRFFVMIW